jgi:hypothetical protein
MLAGYLTLMGDYDKLKQIMTLLKPCSENPMAAVYRSLIRGTSSMHHLNSEGYSDRCKLEIIPRFGEILRGLESSPHLPKHCRASLSSITEFLTSAPLVQNLFERINDSEWVSKQFVPLLDNCEQSLSSLSLPSMHPLWSYLRYMRGVIEAEQGNHMQGMEYFRQVPLPSQPPYKITVAFSDNRQ